MTTVSVWFRKGQGSRLLSAPSGKIGAKFRLSGWSLQHGKQGLLENASQFLDRLSGKCYSVLAGFHFAIPVTLLNRTELGKIEKVAEPHGLVKMERDSFQCHSVSFFVDLADFHRSTSFMWEVTFDSIIEGTGE